MEITIVGRKCTPRDSFRERAERKLAKIGHFFGGDVEAKITATVEKAYQTVEVTIVSGGLTFRAQQQCENMNDALDRCADQLVRQIRKNKTKVEKRLKRSSPAEFDFAVPQGEDIPEEIDYEIVRKKVLTLKPQSVDEAILEMNMLGHKFYMYLDESTNGVAVIYQRSNGGYGLLTPEIT
ncbi:MAG: ribosome-associated translation inhibitor RaiA [Oscillospiraceae bacterium]|nr:ribosome-associated translation inhibitor RaiA [Oscillospiraceae bacterium]